MNDLMIQIIRSNRKTLSLEIKKDKSVLVRAPYRMTNLQIKHFINQKEKWIREHLQKIEMAEDKKEALPKLSAEEMQELVQQALKVFPAKVHYFAEQMQIHYGRITIRNQKTRWGSCSQKGNLNFNCLLMLAPDAVIDYVVVHELCHILEMNHSTVFWNHVERIMPDYKIHRKWLKEHGEEIMSRRME